MAGLWKRPADLDPVDTVLRLTLLLLLLRPIGDWTLRFPILAIASLGLLAPGLVRHPGLWLSLTSLTALRVVVDWPLPDNHAYLLVYWCLAIAISRFAADDARVLAWNGRWLVVGVFGLAVLWKLALSPDFSDGTFFRATLLLDPRFEDFTRVVGGLSLEQIETARAALGRHADGGQLEPLAAYRPGGRFDWLARGATIWTLAIEVGVALGFAWPLGRGPSRARHALLILFCVTTYAVATVEGFGWLLVAMGLAQCPPEHRRTRLAYLGTYLLILFYREVDWMGMLAESGVGG